MLKEGSIVKMGKHPEIFYSRNPHKPQGSEFDSRDSTDKNLLEIYLESKILEDKPKISDYRENVGIAMCEIIDHEFMMIDSIGNRVDGFEGFVSWCQKRGFDVVQKAKEYIGVLNKISVFKGDNKSDRARSAAGLISGMKKLKETFSAIKLPVFLDEAFYIDFYSIEVFGKTKLGQMILYAKQGQDKKLMSEVVLHVKSKIYTLIKEKHIDAVAFVPPTVKRKVQFMSEIEKGLQIGLPHIKMSKIKGDVVVPQKTLSKLQDRIDNAKQIKVFVMGPMQAESGSSSQENRNLHIPKYKNLLLIDDALGSGATMNEIASQVKKLSVAEHVIGLALTGSFNGFDVINEI